MKNAVWGYAVMVLGILAIIFIFFFANVTNTDQHNYNLLKETVEAAMYDALDLAEYRANGIIQIDEDKFVENFLRRFAENASLRDSYVIEIYDISEKPPKVSLKVSTVRGESTSITGDTIEFKADIVNTIDAILETTYSAEVLETPVVEEEIIEEEIIEEEPEQQMCTFEYEDYFYATVPLTCSSGTLHTMCSGSTSLSKSVSGQSCIVEAADANCYLSGNSVVCSDAMSSENINVSIRCTTTVEGPC